MPRSAVRIYFDFVDPLSYVWSHRLKARPEGVEGTPAVEWIGFELRPPPSALTDTRDPIWVERWSEARAAAAQTALLLDPPDLVPWTRKAHELHIYAAQHGVGDSVRAAIFGAYFGAGKDIGRVDVLVAISGAAGLDPTETKAVLDVDRHEADVTAQRRDAAASGVTDVPLLWDGTRLVEGFPDLTGLGTLLPDT